MLYKQLKVGTMNAKAEWNRNGTCPGLLMGESVELKSENGVQQVQTQMKTDQEYYKHKHGFTVKMQKIWYTLQCLFG